MKKFFCFLTCLSFLMSVLVFPTCADEVQNGTVNSSALNYFTGIVNKLPANSDYVIYRSGDYTTVMYTGYDFVYKNNKISCSDTCMSYVYNQRGISSGNSWSPSFSYNESNGFSLDVDTGSLIYTSLDGWSSVGDNNKDNTTYILWTLVFIVFLFIVFKHFRNRRHYIDL